MRASFSGTSSVLGSCFHWVNSQAYVLLVFTMLTWGANAVAARLAVGEIPPMLLTCLRWSVCCAALALTSRAQIATHWRSLLPRWRSILLMGALGFTGFNALFYAAAHHTTAINIAIIQGTIPVLVLIGSLFLYRTRITGLQIVGAVLTMGGIAVVASQGELARLAALEFNVGDVWIVIACVLYAGFALGLRQRPAVPAIVFFAALAAVAAVVSLPFVAVEIAMGQSYLPSAKGWLLVLFIGLLPSFISQLTFMQGVALIGPARAGMFMNLVPIFGPLLAVLVLGEPLSAYHAVALALVLGGIYIAEYLGARKH
ncbi:DMT family transporter [Variovorax arabinosiphilus]|uniref:DMT family transporter n=1 Tax=Variovorax arabinosiphilus TaxID=3053498 RepID=UPI0025756670|nr:MULTISPECIES: DMT family transporter [unclassified Variovorax]MDM0118273.1 DMT family transporter [Variovorax sp. J2L1-78]MDM0128698.1 DMT family transporter [Variovorax sp. J2L1-63]MDM0233516.1 DMT family transporter [Variovorax sp. J2R1-6]